MHDYVIISGLTSMFFLIKQNIVISDLVKVISSSPLHTFMLQKLPQLIGGGYCVPISW